jgi:hypothetical protein
MTFVKLCKLKTTKPALTKRPLISPLIVARPRTAQLLEASDIYYRFANLLGVCT